MLITVLCKTKRILCMWESCIWGDICRQNRDQIHVISLYSMAFNCSGGAVFDLNLITDPPPTGSPFFFFFYFLHLTRDT